VGFLLAILHPVTARLFALGAIAFHTGITLVLNIAFVPNYIVYAAVLPWSSFVQWLLPAARIVRPMLSVTPRIHPGVVLGTATGVLLAGSPLQWMNDTVSFTSDLVFSDVLALGLAWLFIGGALLVRNESPSSRVPPWPSRRDISPQTGLPHKGLRDIPHKDSHQSPPDSQAYLRKHGHCGMSDLTPRKRE
jgi:hypothetical protein